MCRCVNNITCFLLEVCEGGAESDKSPTCFQAVRPCGKDSGCVAVRATAREERIVG